jgi:hypothetical protein
VLFINEPSGEPDKETMDEPSTRAAEDEPSTRAAESSSPSLEEARRLMAGSTFLRVVLAMGESARQGVDLCAGLSDDDVATHLQRGRYGFEHEDRAALRQVIAAVRRL